MRTPPPYHTAYVLWLIRQGIATSWSELCTHFTMDPTERFTRQNMLLSALRELQRAHLICIDDQDADSHDAEEPFDAAWARVASNRFSVTPLCHEVLQALRLSLSDLAQSHPDQRLIVTPVLQRTHSTRYQSDILVFMPFTEELAPVFEDHVKAVAGKLGKSVARADDYFTNDQIVNQIWTALVGSRLVIADCTGRNPNVFYEIGLAHAVGKPTILITQSGDDIPFDLRHRRFVPYELTPRGMRHFEEVLAQTITTVLAEEV